MGKYKLYSSYFPAKQVASYYFHLRNHYGNAATLHLSPDGAYSMDVNGYEDDYIIENRAKRDPQYKLAIQKVTKEMLTAFSNENDHFVMMSKRPVKSIELKDVETERNNIHLEHYQRKVSSIQMPTEDDAIKLLESEADGKYYHSESIEQNVKDFINKNKDSILQDRITCWREVQKLHDDIEKANEDKINSSYLKAYNSKVKYYDDIIEGIPSVIENAFNNIQNTLNVPYSVELDYRYFQDDKTIEIDVEIPMSIEAIIPLCKASLLTSGKISIKKKLQKEIKTDVVDSQMCLMYYISSFAFSITPNLEKCRIALYKENKSYGLCWIEFHKSNFQFYTDPHEFSLIWPIIYNLGELRGAPVLLDIPTHLFKNLIKEKISQEV